MSISRRTAAYAAVMTLAGFALVRAASFRFQEKERAFRQAAQLELQKLGGARDSAKAKYPTPEIHMVTSGCLTPGSTGEIVVKGKFTPGSLILLQNDNLEVVKDNLTPSEYRATVKVAPNIGPQTAAVLAVAPVTAISTRYGSEIPIGGRFEWEMEAANGWRIVARSPAGQACGGQSSAAPEYSMEFYRKGETTAFEKRSAKLYFSLYEGANRFDVSQEAAGGVQAESQALMRKFSDPNLPAAERQKLMGEMEQLQKRLQAEVMKMSDPNYIKGLEAAKAKFGCERIELRQQAGGAFTGEMRCAPAVGARIALTGTLKSLGR